MADMFGSDNLIVSKELVEILEARKVTFNIVTSIGIALRKKIRVLPNRLLTTQIWNLAGALHYN